jgi:hypothetical protein
LKPKLHEVSSEVSTLLEAVDYPQQASAIMILPDNAPVVDLPSI